MNKKLLVHLHIFYHNQVDYILEKLKNISEVGFDLFITYVEDNNETKEKFLNFKPDTVFIKLPNVGYDIWPFLYILKNTNLDDYDYVLKLHTKSKDKSGDFYWRDDLFDAILGSVSQFKKCIKLIDKNKAGIVAAKNRIALMRGRWPEDTYLFDEVCDRLNIEKIRKSFVAGTMFLSRASLLKSVRDLNFKEADFKTPAKSHSCGTVSHVAERLITILPQLIPGGELYGIKLPEKHLWHLNLIKKIFSIQNCGCKKVFTVFGIKFYKDRYKYKTNGKLNRIFILENNDLTKIMKVKKINGLDIKICGDGNYIEIAQDAKFENVYIEINSNINDIVIGHGVSLKNSKYIIGGTGYNFLNFTAGAKISEKERNFEKGFEKVILSD